MRVALSEAKQRLVREIDSYSVLPGEPIAADPWIISSLLKKSIRRSETRIAQRAALTLFKLRGSAIWRRFVVIAFEDVGIGSVDAVTMTVAAGSDAALRKACGGDLRVAVHLAGVLTFGAMPGSRPPVKRPSLPRKTGFECPPTCHLADIGFITPRGSYRNRFGQTKP